jgi:Calcium-dependent channel, 7TM region, putative phosphate
MMLELVTQFEGAISGSLIEASLFLKLTAFTIIQVRSDSIQTWWCYVQSLTVRKMFLAKTFFVSALSGAILQEISKLLQNPKAVVDLLATSLPAQSTFFLQMSVVMTTTTFAVEGLRIVPIVLGLLRNAFGPKLTQREKESIFMGLRPFSKPDDFPHADFLSNMASDTENREVLCGFYGIILDRY